MKMKKMLIALAVTVSAITCMAVDYASKPAYVKGHYYVFPNEVIATSALTAINESGWFPITGNNAKTGKPAPDKAKTTKWCSSVQERVDGKWVFPRIPDAILDAINVSEAERKGWWDTFTPDVESYQSDWFPVPEGM
jgi:hypothetical protein